MDSYTRLFARDPMNGITEWWTYDPSSESATIVTQQDVEPILEASKVDFNEFDPRARWGNKPMIKVASIPLSIAAQMWKTGMWKDKVAMKKWLNDKDNQPFRTRPGRV